VSDRGEGVRISLKELFFVMVERGEKGLDAFS